MATTRERRPLLRGLIQDFRALTRAPRDLWIVYGVKLLESVSYFAMLNVLVLYLHEDLRLSDEWSGAVFGAWGTVVSLLTFLAGFVADAMGQRKALIIAAFTAVLGRAMLLTSEIPAIPLLGLAVGAWAVASMKPVMTAAIKTHAPTKVRAFAYSIFYVVMNLGAFVAGHVVSLLRTSLLGRVVRPGELLGGAEAASEEAQRALVEELVPALRPSMGKLADAEAVRSVARVATGGRDLGHWTVEDLTRVREGMEAHVAGQPLPGAPFGWSGYEMIFLVAALLSVVSLLLLRAMRPDRPVSVGPGDHASLGVRAVLARAVGIGAGLFKEKTFWAYLLFICVLVLVRAIFVHAHSTWPNYMVREFGHDTPFAAYWSLNPALIMILTPVIGSATSRFSAWWVIMTGSFITATSVLCMVWGGVFEEVAQAALSPVFDDGLDYRVAGPIAFIVVLSVGEALWSPRLYEYVAVMAPPGREASYMGLTQLPMFAAKPLVGLMSGFLVAAYVPERGPHDASTMWLIIFATTLAGPLIALAFAGTIRAAEKERLEAAAATEGDRGG
ncbi:MAG TPA: MFS transporter [Sandaracinaceae bacterium LLY-WYZ-13_1]|nr:MFS transporter [Sandaracinaceae bacterium LLY-WYZ-13_1]